MATFAYIARDSGGDRVVGRLSALSEQAVLAELESRQLAPVQVRQERERRMLRRGVPVRQTSTMYRQLSDLLRAGVPLLRSLRLLAKTKSRHRLGQVLGSVADAVEGGERLGTAMAANPEVFPPVQVAMVHAAERGGFLEQVLSRMATFLEHRADMRSKVFGSLIYPAVLVFMVIVIVVVALVVFVPKFEGFFGDMTLPWATRVLLGASDLLTGSWAALLGSLAVIVGLLFWARRKPAFVRRWSELELRLPLWGPFIRNLAVARFARILGTLLDNGIPLLQALQVSRDAAGNVLLSEGIDEATEAVRAGETLGEPLSRCGLLDEDVVEMISVGESANNLPTVLLTTADTIESRIERMLGVLMRLLEPLILLLLAGVIMFLFMALIVPMLRMRTAI